MAQTALPYREYRKDGWPLCPQCEEDELWSAVMMRWNGEGERPTVEECITGGMNCYRCGWESGKAIR